MIVGLLAGKDKMKDRYRIEQMGPQPEELVGVVEPLEAEWVLVRNHDDEPMSIYGTRKEAEAALREANVRALRTGEPSAGRQYAGAPCSTIFSVLRCR